MIRPIHIDLTGLTRSVLKAARELHRASLLRTAHAFDAQAALAAIKHEQQAKVLREARCEYHARSDAAEEAAARANSVWAATRAEIAFL